MRQLSVIAFLMSLLIALHLPTVAATNITVCRDNSVAWVRFRFSGLTEPNWYVWFGDGGASGPSSDGTLIVDADSNTGTAHVGILVGGEQVYDIIEGTLDTPECGEELPAQGPDGGLVEITKDAAPGCYQWEIRDAYDHWSNVAVTCSQVEGERVFVRLVLGRDNPDHNPEDYRISWVEMP